MKLSEKCIQQPVLAIVLSLVLTVLGYMGFQQLEILFSPKQVMPIVSIHTYYEGASADLMESQVSTLIENALSGVDGIDYISSSSGIGYSSVTVQFLLGGNFEDEAAEVRDKISAIDEFPADADAPIVTVGVDDPPLMGISFIDKNKSSPDVRDYLSHSVTPILRQLPGVGAVSTLGSTGYAMRVWLDSTKMASVEVTVSDIKSAITSNNIYFPAGAFRGPTRSYSILSDAKLKNADEFSNIVVSKTSTGVIRLKDVAKVELGYSSMYPKPLEVNNVEGVMLVVSPLQSANPIAVAKEVRESLDGISKRLPPGMTSHLVYDNSVYLESSINETFIAIGESILLVILVVLFFLGSFRSASIPIVTIPISLISVFAVISLLGFTINIMSLLGMVLAIGLVVDDAIVVLENIHRHIELGLSPLQAAYKGTKEIAHAVMVMTLTLVAVYAPIGFMQGVTAEFYKEFAYTLAAAVLISGFVALTLSPMMCSKLLKSNHKQSRLADWLDTFFNKLAELYQVILEFMLNKRFLVIVVLIAIATLGIYLFKTIDSEMIPSEDYGSLTVTVRSPTGSTIDYTNQYAKQAVDIIKKRPEVDTVVTQFSDSWTNVYAYLKPEKERKLSTQQVIAELNPELKVIPGVTAIASMPDIISYGDTGSDVTLNFTTAQDYSKLLGPMDELMLKLKPYPGLLNLSANLSFDSQQYSLTINRDLAATLGVDIQVIADTVHAMMSGIHVTDVQSGSYSYSVKLQMEAKDLTSFTALDNIYVPTSVASTTSSSVSMVPLSSLVTLKPVIGQGSLKHFNRMRSGAISALISPGYTESEVLTYINSLLPSVLNPSVNAQYSGKAAQYLESSGNMTSVMILSFVFIYLVLSAQFGSFIDPFIILLAVPLSLVGALFSLWLSGGTLNLYSQIGLVTLVGLVSKHGILITQFVNDLRSEGMDFKQAIIDGATLRLRPILMTTVAMVVGALPLALASGSGSVGREAIGWVIVGGLIVGTFFSLIVVPVAYSFLGKYKTFKQIEQPL